MSRIEEIINQIEDLRLELFEHLTPHPIGTPVYVFDRWKRVGTFKGFTKVNGQAAIVINCFTKDKTPYDYYCYEPHKVRELK